MRAARRSSSAADRAPRHGSALFFEPTILDRVTEPMAIAREETFGPVVPITAIDGEAAALEIINASPYGLLTAVFTRDLGAASGSPSPRAPDG